MRASLKDRDQWQGGCLFFQNRRADRAAGQVAVEFSSLLMGVVRFRSLHHHGLAEISDPRYVEAVDALFSTEEKPVCTTDF